MPYWMVAASEIGFGQVGPRNEHGQYRVSPPATSIHLLASNRPSISREQVSNRQVLLARRRVHFLRRRCLNMGYLRWNIPVCYWEKI